MKSSRSSFVPPRRTSVSFAPLQTLKPVPPPRTRMRRGGGTVNRVRVASSHVDPAARSAPAVPMVTAGLAYRNP